MTFEKALTFIRDSSVIPKERLLSTIARIRSQEGDCGYGFV